jgi:hypothetical protein
VSNWVLVTLRELSIQAEFTVGEFKFDQGGLIEPYSVLFAQVVSD